MNCLYCGKDMIYSTMLRSDAKFCKPEHQKEYWTLRRKIKRHQKRALDAVAALNVVLYGSTDLAFLAADILRDIEGAANAAGSSLRWRCRECDQTVFVRPIEGQTCDFCDHEEWSIMLPKAPQTYDSND